MKKTQLQLEGENVQVVDGNPEIEALDNTVTDEAQKVCAEVEAVNIPEFNFDDGVKHAVSIIKKLIESGKKYIVIAINGASTDVGKTTLRMELQKIIRGMNMPAVSIKGTSESDPSIDGFIGDLQFSKTFYTGDCSIIILEQEPWRGISIVDRADHDEKSWRLRLDQDIERFGKKVNLPIENADLIIGIHSLSCSFPKINGLGEKLKPLADFIIMNEKAKRKR
ncbi:hypothetical protein ACFL3T_01960 [Patescibacteria group bacterium]